MLARGAAHAWAPGRKEAAEVSLADVAEAQKRFAALELNGDGIVHVDSTDDGGVRAFITDVMATLGSVPDRSGKPGVDRPKVDAFVAGATAWRNWNARADAEPSILPLGKNTAGAADAVSAVASKIDDFFTRCRLVAFDPRAAAVVGGSEADLASNAALAALSGTYLAYCDCTRPAGGKVTIAAAFTSGDSDNLMVGRNGIFIDRQGRDWDATITKIISNPISFGEAFFSPYKKFARMLEEQFAKRAAAARGRIPRQACQDCRGHGACRQGARCALRREEDRHRDCRRGGRGHRRYRRHGGSMMGAFFGLGRWMPLGLLALVLMISGPSMMLAYLKLRQRNLGPILDAGGWALNGRVRINVPFGRALTDLATLPAGATRVLRDPYAEKRSPWRSVRVVVVLLVALSWYLGKLDRFLASPARSTSVLGKYAPTALPEAVP